MFYNYLEKLYTNNSKEKHEKNSNQHNITNTLDRNEYALNYMLKKKKETMTVHQGSTVKSVLLVSKVRQTVPIVPQSNKCLKFMTFQGDVSKYAIECKYVSGALKTFCHHQFHKR